MPVPLTHSKCADVSVELPWGTLVGGIFLFLCSVDQVAVLAGSMYTSSATSNVGFMELNLCRTNRGVAIILLIIEHVLEYLVGKVVALSPHYQRSLNNESPLPAKYP